MKQHRIEDDGRHVWKQSEYQDCVYDMMSIFLRARNFDASQYKVGQNIPMPVSDAKRLSHSWLKYRGKETYKMEGNNIEYRCLVFSFIEREDGENKELLRFYVTDDANHIPVRLDMFLSFRVGKGVPARLQGGEEPRYLEAQLSGAPRGKGRHGGYGFPRGAFFCARTSAAAGPTARRAAGGASPAGAKKAAAPPHRVGAQPKTFNDKQYLKLKVRTCSPA